MPTVNLPNAKKENLLNLKFGTVSVGSTEVNSKKEETKPTDSLKRLENAVNGGVFKNDIENKNE